MLFLLIEEVIQLSVMPINLWRKEERMQLSMTHVREFSILDTIYPRERERGRHLALGMGTASAASLSKIIVYEGSRKRERESG